MQLGIFSRNQIGSKSLHAFLDAIPDSFHLVQIALNKFNRIHHEGWKNTWVSNFELDLILPSGRFIQKFDKKFKHDLELAKGKGFSIINNITPNDLLVLWKNNNSVRHLVDAQTENILRKILSRGIHNQIVNISGVYSAQNNLCAAVAFFHFKHTSTPLIIATDNKIDEKLALLWLFYNFILEYAGKNHTLKFEPVPASARPVLAVRNYSMGKFHFKLLSEIITGLGAQQNNYQVIEKLATPFFWKLIRPLFLKNISLLSCTAK